MRRVNIIEVVEIPDSRRSNRYDALERDMVNDVAAVIVQYPKFYGQIEPLKEIEEIIHQEKCMFVVSSNPLALGLLNASWQIRSGYCHWRCTAIWYSKSIWRTALRLLCNYE